MAPSRFMLSTSSIGRGPIFDPLCVSIAAISSLSCPQNKCHHKQTSPSCTLPPFCMNSRSLVISSLNFARTALHPPPFENSQSDICPSAHRLHCWAPRAGGGTEIQSSDSSSPALLQRPAYVPREGIVEGDDNKVADLQESLHDDEEECEEGSSEEVQSLTQWVDWEDEILQDTRPLVGFARMILHSDRYKNGERLNPEDEKVILTKFLPYHPDVEEKIGSGVDFIMVHKFIDVCGGGSIEPITRFEDLILESETLRLSSLQVVPGIDARQIFYQAIPFFTLLCGKIVGQDLLCEEIGDDI